jgi:hypothetical protein
MHHKITLNASLVFKDLLTFEPSLRVLLLDLQASATRRPSLAKLLSVLG